MVSTLSFQMLLEKDKYYHLYNRSNNREIVFKEDENYHYFLDKYRSYCTPYFETAAYCLMRTHFHFLVRFVSENLEGARKAVGLLLSSYTKAINAGWKRHGSLFQPHTKAIEIADDTYLLTLVSYIHQNPVRAGMVKHMEDWPHSSYRNLLDEASDAWQKNKLLKEAFASREAFRVHSEQMLESIRIEFWV
jgi:putative transposase